MIHQNSNNAFLLTNNVLYAHAFNNDMTSLSEAYIDLDKTPFTLDKESQKFAGFGEYIKYKIKFRTNQSKSVIKSVSLFAQGK